MKKKKHKARRKSFFQTKFGWGTAVVIAILIGGTILAKATGLPFLNPLSINRVDDGEIGGSVKKTTTTTTVKTPPKTDTKTTPATPAVKKAADAPTQTMQQCLAKGRPASECGSLAAATATLKCAQGLTLQAGKCVDSTGHAAVAPTIKTDTAVPPSGKTQPPTTLTPATTSVVPANPAKSSCEAKGNRFIDVQGEGMDRCVNPASTECGDLGQSFGGKCYYPGDLVPGTDDRFICDWTHSPEITGRRYPFNSNNCPEKSTPSNGTPTTKGNCTGYAGLWIGDKCHVPGDHIKGSSLHICNGKEAVGPDGTVYPTKNNYRFAYADTKCPEDIVAEIEAKLAAEKSQAEKQEALRKAEELKIGQARCAQEGRSYNATTNDCGPLIKPVTTAAACGNLTCPSGQVSRIFKDNCSCTAKPNCGSSYDRNTGKTTYTSCTYDNGTLANVTVNTCSANETYKNGSCVRRGSYGTVETDKNKCVIPEKAQSVRGGGWLCPNADGTLPSTLPVTPPAETPKTVTIPSNPVVQNYNGKVGVNVTNKSECLLTGAERITTSGTEYWRCPDANGQTRPPAQEALTTQSGKKDVGEYCFSMNNSCETGYCKKSPTLIGFSKCDHPPQPLSPDERDQTTIVAPVTDTTPAEQSLIRIIPDANAPLVPEKPAWMQLIEDPQAFFRNWWNSRSLDDVENLINSATQ